MEIRPEAAQLADLARDWPEINHLYIIENVLRRLVPGELQEECDLSLTLTDSGAIMMVLEAVEARHSAACQAAAMDVAERINTPSSPSDDDDDTLKPLARTARLLGGFGANVAQQSLQDQANIVTSDINSAQSSATNQAINSYNDRVKSLESYAQDESSSGSANLLTSSLPITLVLLLLATAGTL